MLVVVLGFSFVSINSSTSFFRMNSNGWKSFSILSTITISSRFTNLLNSVSRLFETFFSLSKVCFISRFSFLISFISSSVFCFDAIKFLPRRRTRSLIRSCNCLVLMFSIDIF